MLHIKIPGREELFLEYLVLDYNGTIAKDGRITNKTKEYIKKISEILKIYVITADTGKRKSSIFWKWNE